MLEVRVLWGHPPQPRRGGKEPACRAPRYSKPQLLARLESMKNCGMPLSAYPNNGRPGLETHLRLQPHIFVERCEKGTPVLFGHPPPRLSLFTLSPPIIY